MNGTMLFGRLNAVTVSHCDEPLFDLAAVRANFTVEDLPKSHWLVTHFPDDTHVNYALLGFVQSDMDGNDTLVHRVFEGVGTGGSLREMRHTYFGPDLQGYVFYLPIDAVIAIC